MKKVPEISISYKSPQGMEQHPYIKSSAEAYAVLLPFFKRKTIALQEQFVVGYLARNGQVKGIYTGFHGGLTGTVADVRIILAIALKSGSSSIILAHNHPSGNLQPSEADVTMTKKFKSACETMDLSFIDHLIISPFDAYMSFSDSGIILITRSSTL